MKSIALSLAAITTLLCSNSLKAVTPIPTSGLVAYYPFNGNGSDASGNNRNLTLSSFNFTNGLSGQCLSYNGSGRGIYTNAASLRTNAYSVSAWINPISISRGFPEWSYIFQVDTNCFLRFGQSNIPSTYQEIDFLYSGTNTRVSNLNSNVWQHIVATQQGSTAKVYFNGVLVLSKTNISPTTFDLNNYVIGNSGGFQYPVGGMIDEVRVYNRALTAQEVRSLYTTDQQKVLVYTLSATGTQSTPATNQSIASKGFFLADNTAQQTAFIWTSTNTMTYSVETHSDMDVQNTGTRVGAVTLYSLANTNGSFPNVEKDLIWMSGNNAGVALNSNNNISAPSSISGTINTLALQGGTSIEKLNTTLSLDSTNTLSALTNGETLTATVTRLTNSLNTQGYSLSH